MDKLSPEHRRLNMQRIKSQDTKPEKLIRKIVYAAGHRYRINFKGLPGKPDLVFLKKKKAILVNGCFWHMHDFNLCKIAHLPKSRTDYWRNKLLKNVERDRRNLILLSEMGYEVLVIWECELDNSEKLLLRINSFLLDSTVEK